MLGHSQPSTHAAPPGYITRSRRVLTQKSRGVRSQVSNRTTSAFGLNTYAEEQRNWQDAGRAVAESAP